MRLVGRETILRLCSHPRNIPTDFFFGGGSMRTFRMLRDAPALARLLKLL